MRAARLVVEVHGAESGYAPARPLETINCHHILLAARDARPGTRHARRTGAREVLGEFARIQDAEKAAASTVTMLALGTGRTPGWNWCPRHCGEQNKPSPALAEARASD
jgi:hypothetical protein